jgi:hypothetical protein
MSAKTRAEVFVQPKGRRPLKRTTIVNYSNPAELRKQLEAYAATVWISAKKIIVDTHAKEIIVDSVPVANFVLHIAGQPAPVTPAVPVTARRRQRPAARRYMRETAGQLGVIVLGLVLILAAAGSINGLFLAGFALLAFGVYRLALGVQRREAAAATGRRQIRTVAELPGQVAA